MFNQSQFPIPEILASPRRSVSLLLAPSLSLFFRSAVFHTVPQLTERLEEATEILTQSQTGSFFLMLLKLLVPSLPLRLKQTVVRERENILEVILEQYNKSIKSIKLRSSSKL